MRAGTLTALAAGLMLLAAPAGAQDVKSIINNLDKAMNNQNQGADRYSGSSSDRYSGSNSDRYSGSSSGGDIQSVQQQVRRLNDQQLRREADRVDQQMQTLRTEQRALSDEMNRRNIR